MRIVDSHFHWWPRSVFESLRKRPGYPRVEVNSDGDYVYLRGDGSADYKLITWPAWFDLDEQLAHMDGLGHESDVVCSIGPFSVAFSELPAPGTPFCEFPAPDTQICEFPAPGDGSP